MSDEAQSPMTHSTSARGTHPRVKRVVNLMAWCRYPNKVRHTFTQKVGRVLAARAVSGIEYLVEWGDRTRSWEYRRRLELVTEQLALTLQEN